MAHEEKEMTLIGHIEELRRRLLISLAGLAIVVVASFFFGEKVVAFLAEPIGGLQKLQSIEITENIGVYMRVSLLAGFILAFPVILYEILLFILPGLKPTEKKFVFWAIPLGTIFFLGGVVFAFKVMLPAALPFLTEFLGVTTTPRLSSYISFVTGLLFWIGVCFEMPLFIFIIARFGLVTPQILLHYWRQAIVIISIAAAVITPTVDPVNMALLMAPLIVLYFISVFFAWMAQRGRKQEVKES